jgi:periplasmic copper chaperone A
VRRTNPRPVRAAHRRVRGALVAVATGAAVVALVAPAGAHISPTESEYVAGEFSLIELGVPHGCGESPTTEIAIQIPEPINAVTPTVNPGWEVEVVRVDLPEAVVDAHGNEITDRVDQVVYTADTPLPNGLRTSFTLSLQIPDIPGETLHFPVIQRCEEGQTDWIQIAAEGEDEPEHPAPAIHVVAGDGTGGHGDAAADDAVEEAAVDGEQAAAVTDADDDGGDALAIVALVVGALGLVVGGVALVSARKRPTPGA